MLISGDVVGIVPASPIVLWIVGEPGVGKTTLARRILLEAGPPNAVVPKPKWTIFGLYAKPDAAAVGTWNGDAFDGGDTVPIGDIKPALAYYADHLVNVPLVVFDGDKFANDNAVRYVAACGSLPPRLVCLNLVGPEAAAAGRAERSKRTGKIQDPTWVAGRRTKSARFAENFPGAVYVVRPEDVQEPPF